MRENFIGTFHARQKDGVAEYEHRTRKNVKWHRRKGLSLKKKKKLTKHCSRSMKIIIIISPIMLTVGAQTKYSGFGLAMCERV